MGRLAELAETEEPSDDRSILTQGHCSAIPIPDPQIEKKKKVLVYDPTCHDYSKDKPKWVEITPGHFVLANEEELRQYEAMAG